MKSMKALVKWLFSVFGLEIHRRKFPAVDFYPPNWIRPFDDYGSARFHGAKLAVDEFLAARGVGEVFFLPLTSGQAFLVKLV